MPTLTQAAHWSADRRRRLGRKSFAGYGTEPLTVTFPTVDLDVRARVALGADLTASDLTWNWLDVTDWLRYDLGVAVEAGRRDERTVVTASKCQAKLDNSDGTWARRNPLSPYFGQLTKNTPIWFEVNPGDGWHTRYQGYINEWPVRWTDPSGTDSTVTIQCAGVLRRLAQGRAITHSLDATILADNPTYYWRLDDGEPSVYALSSRPNGDERLLGTGVINWRTLESAPGGDGETSVAQINDGNLRASIVGITAPWSFEYSVLRPTDDSLAGDEIAGAVFDVSGAETSIGLGVSLDSSNTARDWYHYLFTATQNGGNYEIKMWKNGTAQGVVKTGAGTLNDLIFFILGGGVADVVAADFGFSYLAMYDGIPADPDDFAQRHSDGLQAYNSEQAHQRIIRLCTEAGVPVHCTSASSAVMGPQRQGATLLELLRECEAADHGLLYEHGFGLGYISLDERYNALAALQLDFDAGHILGTPEPADDDQRLRNRWTVTRPGGGSATAEQDTGPNGTQAGGPGVFDDQTSLNLEDDSQLIYHASHLVRVGTVDEDRWPRLTTFFHDTGNTTLIPDWLALPLLGRVTAANPPTQMAPHTVDAIAEGYTERFDSRTWTVSLNTSPASIYQAGVAGGGAIAGAWLQTDEGTQLASALASGATSATVTVDGPLFTTDATELAESPLTVEIGGPGGERCPVTAISGGSSPQTFTLTRTIARAWAAGSSLQVYQPLVAVL